MRHRWCVVASCPMLLLAAAAMAQPPSYGIDFVTIGDPGNAPSFVPDPGGVSFTEGRGTVGYEFRIGRMETTTAQWMEFVNTYSTMGGFDLFGRPSSWGGEVDPTYSGPGLRYRLRVSIPNAAMVPVLGIGWRTCAQYCNWLHNAKAPTVAAIASGAYDASTFTTNPTNPPTFNDQWTRSPGAKFWIPSLDEWMKATHYDPNRNGPGQGGWWMYPHGSDTPLVYGPPGQGQANAGFTLPSQGQSYIPLGSYPDVLSPYGLIDAAGAAQEWMEEVLFPTRPTHRGIGGSGARGTTELTDRVTRFEGSSPISTNGTGDYPIGLRIASVIPAPSAFAAFAPLISVLVIRRKRQVARLCHD
ncbi:MAG: SUMF1/EgtB/PvdO family nonheme iron enzyme [Phycisphaerales bacterium]